MRTLFWVLVSSFFITCNSQNEYSVDESWLLHYAADTDLVDLEFFWKSDSNRPFRNLINLKSYLDSLNIDLIFAMNGGMYNPDLSPKGLFIQDYHEITPIDTAKNGYGNFYLQPNGVFYITEDKKAGVCNTSDYKFKNKVRYATQSGPMLLTGGKINSKFIKGSKNLHIRNGVGILPNGEILFAMSKKEMNFYDFATFFKQNGCENALYLDGFVSQVYYQKKYRGRKEQNLGVLIGVLGK